MKNWKSLPAICLLLFLSATHSSFGQGSIDELHSNALTAMKTARSKGMPDGAADWNAALGLLRQATNTYDGRAPQLFGPKFGWFWYHQGFCELKLGKFEEAIESFETCYTKYANKDGKQGNDYQIKSLLKWGEAAQGAQKWDVAIQQYKKFLAERDPERRTDNFEKGAFYINLAICHFSSDKIAGGLENLEIAIRNKDVFPTPAAGIMAGFQSLCETVIRLNKEQALIDFLKKNRAEVKLEPWEAQPFSPIFMKLAANALKANMGRAAFELYAMVPSSIEAKDDLRARLASLGDYRRPIRDGAKILQKDALDAQLDQTKEREKKGLLPEITALAATAFIHEKNGNVRGAYSAYDMLERFHSNSPKDKREEYLYHLIRTSSTIGRVFETERHGQKFLKLFPGSKYEESVRSLMLSSLFFEGEYETCLEVAGAMEPELEKEAPSKQHDIALHVLGGSYFYTGQFDKAVEYLKEHPKLYPESQFKIAARYFEGSNYAALQMWKTAASLLDKFLDDFPNPKENAYLPFALYDRANCHFAEEEYEDALNCLNRVETEFPEAGNRERVFNLKGNILQVENKADEAEKYYLKALNLAERKENKTIAGDSLFYLVGLLGEEKNPRIKEALPYYDKFWAEYGSDSPYKAQMAVAGLPALDASNRSQEGLDRLQGVIAQLAKRPGAFGLEEAINSYTKFFLKNKENTEEKLKQLYYDFPGINREDKAAQAILRIALIGVFEDISETAAKEDDERAVSKANASIKVLFEDLKKDFELNTLSNFILVSVGDYLREKTNSPRQAIPYYEEALGRSDQSYRFPAMFGLADVYGRSDSAGDLEKSAKQLLRVYDDSKDKSQKEQALFRATEVYAKLKNWDKTKELSRSYLDPEKNYNQFAPQASLLLGQAFDALGDKKSALAVFARTNGAYTGLISVSAPSMKRYMELLWERNKTATSESLSDKQQAYNFGHQFLEQTRHIRSSDRMDETDRVLWDAVEDLVLKYEANPSVTPAPKKQEQ